MFFELNWTTQVYSHLFGSVILILCIIIISLEIKKSKSKFLIILLLIWIFTALFNFWGAIAFLTLSLTIYKIYYLFLIPIAFMSIYSIDLLKNARLGSLKMLLLGISSTGLIYALFDPSNIYTDNLNLGGQTFKIKAALNIWTSIYILIIVTFFSYYCLINYLKAAKEDKRAARIILIGGSLYGLLPFVLFIFKIHFILPGILMVFQSLGALVLSLSFRLSPNLIKILDRSIFQARMNLIGKFLPICAECKKIRDSEGNWHPIEKFFNENSDIKFTHGLCPDCMEKLLAEIDNYKPEK